MVIELSKNEVTLKDLEELKGFKIEFFHDTVLVFI